MKKITLLFTICAFLMANVINAQTVVWSSDLEDYADWGGFQDLDGDTNNWGYYNSNASDIAVGFSGIYASSFSYSANGPLTPDNLLYTPTMSIPEEAVVITYKMKVAASYTPDFAENFTVYVYDDATGPSIGSPIYTETLSAGGAGTAKLISAEVPATFAGKTVRFIIRHHDCTNQARIMVDDFEVSYTTSAQTVNTETIDWGIDSTPSETGNRNASRTIEVGDTVTWNWYAGGTHNVKSNASATETFESDYFGNGGTFSYTFTSEGSNEYVCSPHPNTMFGTITVVAEGALSTSEARRLNFEMFPNPASDKVSIQLPSGAENATVEFYDSLGRLALSKKVTRINNKMDVNALSKGIYILKVFTADQIGSQKFIKN
jgi:plastocyanin